MRLLERIAAGERVSEPVALVLAHPDDETASAAGLLQRLECARLIYLTDGAPRDLVDARRVGLDSWQAYAEVRKRELSRALPALGVGEGPIFYDVPDKEAVDNIRKLVERLASDLAGCAAVVTHPYENGHPDHDTAALVVARACARMTEPPEHYEFASYHLEDGEEVYGRFWPDPDSPEVAVRLGEVELRRKRDAIACYPSQRGILSEFPLGPERLRRAPRYDFTAPAAPGHALYDEWHWNITSADWLAKVVESVD